MSPLSTARTKLTLKAAEHPIQTVTVFRSSNAQIVRVLTLDLKAGNNEVEITGLSSAIDPESLRVSGLGDARLADVVCVVDRSTSLRSTSVESQVIREAKAKIRDLEFEKEAREAEVEILFNYGKALSGTTVTPDAVSTFAETAVSKKMEVMKIVRRLEQQIEEQQMVIENTQVPKGQTNGKAKITVFAADAGTVQLTISYLVGNVRWTPTYDLHANSSNGPPSSSVSLHYRVHLTQSTGENWNDTSLILSTTATDYLNAGIPEPPSLAIQATANFKPSFRSAPPPVALMAKRAMSARKAPAERERESELLDLDFEDDVAYTGPIEESIAFVSKSPLSITYTVDGKSTIPSDGDSHKVTVAQLPFEAVISHVTVPRKAALAYLQCEVKNSTDYHLLPGPVSVFMDGEFVSKTAISDINTGDIFRCTLGVDTSTRVNWNLTSTSETSKASSFVEQYKTTKYVSTTTIQNRHTDKYPISIIEKSSVPVAPVHDDRIRVFLRKPNGLAESEDGVEVDLGRADGFKVKWNSLGDDLERKGGKKTGKFVWLGKIEPGKEVVLVSEWEVRAPIDAQWSEKSQD